jgi:hypothetical protein
MGVWRNFLIVLALFICVAILVNSDFGANGRYYDCRDAHWMPDVPIEVKQRCADLFYEEYKRRQKEEADKKVIRT